MGNFLFEATIYLGAAVIAVPLAARFGFGSVLGYLVAGLIIGPITGLTGADTAELQHFAEFGVVMMLFLIGLELEPKALWKMRHRLAGLGGLQILLTTGLGYLGADIVLDKGKGPMLLELNARPGLAIQVANRMGLRPLIEAVMKADIDGLTAEQRVELGKKIYREHVPEHVHA